MTTTYVDRPYLSIVLPAFNESHRLPATLDEIRPYLQEHYPSHEVVVVNDGSNDRTSEIVREYSADWPQLRLLEQPRNIGKGAAVRRGCLEAEGQIIAFMDADLATPINEIPKMLAHFHNGSYSAVVGVRTYQENESKWRRIVGLSLQIIAHLIVFEKAVIDSQCGFKCFDRNVAHAVFALSRIDGGMFDVEIFYIMHRIGIEIYYQPVHWLNKAGSRINFLRCMVFDIFDLFTIRINGMLGRYRAVAPAKAAQRISTSP